MTLTKERLLELAKNAGVAVFHKDLKKWTIPDRDSQIKLAQLIRNEVLEEARKMLIEDPVPVHITKWRACELIEGLKE